MSKETRIGLLVGLLFIIGFAVVLSQLYSSGRSTPAADNRVATAANAPGTERPFSVLPVDDGSRPADTVVAPASPSPAPAAPERDGSVVVTLGDRPSPAPGVTPAAPGSPTTPDVGSPTGGVETRRLDDPTATLLAAADRSGVPLHVVAPPGRIPDDTADSAATPPPGSVIHEVKQNDNLYTIAKKYYGPNQVSKWTLIRDANKVTPSNLKIGMKLVIPPSPTARVAPAAPSPTTRPAAPDTAAPLSPVIEAPPRVEITMRPTRLAAEEPTAPTTAPAKKYVVQPRDTLYNIARQSGTTVDKLIAINRIRDPKGLQVGMELMLPG